MFERLGLLRISERWEWVGVGSCTSFAHVEGVTLAKEYSQRKLSVMVLAESLCLPFCTFCGLGFVIQAFLHSYL